MIDTFAIATSVYRRRLSFEAFGAEEIQDTPLTAHEQVKLKKLRNRIAAASVRTFTRGTGSKDPHQTWTQKAAWHLLLYTNRLIDQHMDSSNWDSVRDLLNSKELEDILPPEKPKR